MKDNIRHQDQGGEVTVWTYPANGDRYVYHFNDDMELTDKFHVENPGKIAPVNRTRHENAESKKRVAPNVTPTVREYLREQGYDSI